MGIELWDMDLDELEQILYEVSKDNEKDISTFINLLVDMYGGIDIRQFDGLFDFIHNKLGIHSDAELSRMDVEQKLSIISYIHS